MKVLIVDGYNMIHRCRFSWGGGLATGEYNIVYNFLRALRSEIERFTPDKVYFALDGKPTARLNSYSNYKANRVIETDDPEVIEYWEDFHRQKREIIRLVSDLLPVVSSYHPDYEADDIIYHLTSLVHSDDDVVIVSSDTDFIQILNEYPDRVRLWNPVSKKFRQNTEYDYVSWKAMVGDKTDNIPGVKGVGKKTALKILSTTGALEDRMKNLDFSGSYSMSYNLIKLSNMESEFGTIEYSDSSLCESDLVSSFNRMQFHSMVNTSYATSFIETFRNLKNKEIGE